MTHHLNHLDTEFSARPNLRYPFGKSFCPEPGEPLEVANGVFWLRVPLPIALDHINLWLLKDDEGWVIVDSGYDAPVCTEVWETVFSRFCAPESVNRIIITHYHPDHIGLAAWLAHRCDCKIHVTQGEYGRYRKIVDRSGEQAAPSIEKFVSELGFSQEQQVIYNQFFSVDKKPAESRVQGEDCVFIQDGDLLTIGGNDWRIVVGNGHSPEHACLYSPKLNVLISGDQALPRISSNISVYFSNQLEDPLSDWLDSCAKLRDQIPVNTLILPSHQEPFYGHELRMQQLIDDHYAQLNRLRIGLVEQHTACSAMPLLFQRELNEGEKLMATGETLAHINYLWHRDEIEKTRLEDGTLVYQMNA